MKLITFFLEYIKNTPVFKEFNPCLIKLDGLNFLWFTWSNGKRYHLYWECQGPIWWVPKLEIAEDINAFRVGWLWFAVGLGGNPTTASKTRTN